MSCSIGNFLIKSILFMIHFVWIIFGLITVAIGVLMIYVQFNVKSIYLKDVDFLPYAIFSIAVGVVFIIISLCGCCGVIVKSRFATLTYSVILFIFIVIKIVIFVTINEKFVQKITHEKLQGIYEDENSNKYTIDLLQYNFKCCGATDGFYWDEWNNMKFQAGISKLSYSCCDAAKYGNVQCDRGIMYQQGCEKPSIDFILKLKNILGLIALGWAIVEFIASVFSCILAKNM